MFNATHLLCVIYNLTYLRHHVDGRESYQLLASLNDGIKDLYDADGREGTHQHGGTILR